jgi:hypothetical protein
MTKILGGLQSANFGWQINQGIWINVPQFLGGFC